MDTASKLQDPRATARWHNIWLGTALFFLVTTVTFSGLFGWAFTQWKEDDACHEYYASLTHLPLGNYTLPPTTLLFHDGEVYFRKGAAYDASSCEGKLVNQLIKKGNVLDVETSGSRRLDDSTYINGKFTAIGSYTFVTGYCYCYETDDFALETSSNAYRISKGQALCENNNIPSPISGKTMECSRVSNIKDHTYLVCDAEWKQTTPPSAWSSCA